MRPRVQTEISTAEKTKHRPVNIAIALSEFSGRKATQEAQSLGRGLSWEPPVVHLIQQLINVDQFYVLVCDHSII